MIGKVRAWFSRPIKQVWRRLLLILMAVIFCLYVYSTLSTPDSSLLSSRFLPYTLFFFVVFILISVKAGGTMMKINPFKSLRKQNLDEFQLKLGLRAYFVAYQIMLGFLFISLGFEGILAPAWENLTKAGVKVSDVSFMLFLLATVLPVWIAAWLEPNPLRDEGVYDKPLRKEKLQ